MVPAPVGASAAAQMQEGTLQMASRPKRLSIFLPSLAGGGAERVFLNLAQGIASKGILIDLVLVRAEGAYMSQIPASARVIDLKRSRVLSSVPALARYLRQEQPDVLLAAMHANIPALWAKRLASCRGRVVISEHNTLSVVARDNPDLRWRIYPRLAHLFYPWADDIIAVSQGVADDLAAVARLRRDRIQVIYNPVVLPDLHARAMAPLEHPWFKAGEPPVVMAVGRLSAQKAFDTLISAFAQVRRKQSARLLILGEGEERHTLEAIVKRLGLERDVSLPGFVSNPYPFMVHASAFVLSSRWEGLPTVLIEALFCGVRVISTDCPSGPREILADGQHGALVPVQDVSALAKTITLAMDGGIPPPSPESWRPYVLENVVDQYLQILMG